MKAKHALITILDLGLMVSIPAGLHLWTVDATATHSNVGDVVTYQDAPSVTRPTAAADRAVQNGNYDKALVRLELRIDGCSGGSAKNDRIPDCDAQVEVQFAARHLETQPRRVDRRRLTDASIRVIA